MLPPPHLSFPGQKSPPHPCFVFRGKGLSHCEEASSSQLPVGCNPQRECPLLFGRLLRARGVMVWSWGAETGSCHALSLVWKPACVQRAHDSWRTQGPAIQLPLPQSLLVGLFCLLRLSGGGVQEAHHAWETKSSDLCK